MVVKPEYKLYLKYAKLTREIYNQYTDQVEPFGLDEAFLDVGGSVGLFGDGQKIANEIRERIKKELGITVSVGVSYNKVFAKLGSDMKKPDATTVITKEDFKQKVWPLPASDLLYVGRATAARLQKYGIYTIGELANCDKSYLHRWFGVNGDMLWRYANGEDNSVVRKFEDAMNDNAGIKSIGNSTTTPRDLLNAEDMKITVMLLSESVAARLREHKRLCKTVSLWLRDNMADLEDKVKSMYRKTQELREKLKPIDRRLDTLDEHLRQAEMHRKYKAIYEKYQLQKPKHRERFHEAHHAEITLFEAADRYLKGVLNGRTVPPVKAWRAEREKLSTERELLNLEYGKVKDETREVERIKRSVGEILRDEAERGTRAREIALR